MVVIVSDNFLFKNICIIIYKPMNIVGLFVYFYTRKAHYTGALILMGDLQLCKKSCRNRAWLGVNRCVFVAGKRPFKCSTKRTYFPLISFILIYVFNIIELKTIKSTTFFNSILICIERSQSWLTKIFSSNRKMILGLMINYIHSVHQSSMLITHSLVRLGQMEHIALNLLIPIPNMIYPSLYHPQLHLHSSMLLQKLKLEVHPLLIQLKRLEQHRHL